MRYIIYFLLALVATTLGALTGMGGGVMIKPVLDVMGGLDVGSIAMLSSLTVLAMSSVSVSRSLHKGSRISAHIALPLAAGSVLGGVVGSYLLGEAIARSASPNLVVVGQNVLLASMLIISFVYMVLRARMPSLRLKGIFAAAATGFGLGTLSSFLGIGGGPINIAVLMFLFAFTAKEAAFCSLISIVFSQLAKLCGALLTTGLGGYDLRMLPFMAVGGVLGGLIGSTLQRGFSEKKVMKMMYVVQGLVMVLCVINIVRNLA